VPEISGKIMKVVIIKYNAGNIMSVEFALQRQGIPCEITNDFDKIRTADKVIFPGVGEASTTMHYLREQNLDQLLRELKQPVLGICLGMQLMCSYSEEGDTECIGIFEEPVRKFQPVPPEKSPNGQWLKVPHMGWNSLHNLQGEIFDQETEDQYVYFVHSYYVPVGEHTAARTNYILEYSAALQKDNFYATQFHPEKSGPVGEKILENFINI